MKKQHGLLVAALFCGASLAASGASSPTKDQRDRNSPLAAEGEAQIIAKARESFPLKTCVVSDEALGDLGEAAVHVHREAGKPDRVIFVCCDGCIDDFKKEPAKYLAKLDEAAAKATTK